MFKKILTLFAALCVTGSVFAGAMAAEFSSFKKPIVVYQNQPFVVSLTVDPRGHNWKLVSYDRNLIKLTDEQFVPANRQMMEPAKKVWTFVARRGDYAVNQVGHIRMQRYNPYSNHSVIRSFTVIVKK